MATPQCKATAHLRKLKKQKQQLREDLAQLDNDLDNLLQSHDFYQQAIIALIQEDNEPDWIIGAKVAQHYLQQHGINIAKHIQSIQQQINH